MFISQILRSFLVCKELSSRFMQGEDFGALKLDVLQKYQANLYNSPNYYSVLQRFCSAAVSDCENNTTGLFFRSICACSSFIPNLG